MIYFILIAFLLIISIRDIHTKIIADGYTLIGILVGLNYQLFYGDIRTSVLGLTCGVLTVWIMNALKIQRIGGGDCKLMGMIGAFTCWQIALGTALLSYLIFLPVKHMSKQRVIAYAPFITLGFILAGLIYG